MTLYKLFIINILYNVSLATCRKETCAEAYPRAKHGSEAFARVVVRQAHHDSPTLVIPPLDSAEVYFSMTLLFLVIPLFKFLPVFIFQHDVV
jgi:hypothetical protein